MNPLGGLARKAKWLDEHEKDWSSSLLLDSGDLFCERAVVKDDERPLLWGRAQVYVDVYNQMGHVAQGIGDRDLALGVDKLLELSKRAKFPFISSNIVHADTGAPVFKPRLVVNRAGVKVGLLGLLTPKFAASAGTMKDNGIQIQDPIAAAQAQVSALRNEGAQIILVLSHLTDDEAALVVEKVGGITAMLGGQGQGMMRYPQAIGYSYLTDAFNKGKYLSLLTLFVRPGADKLEFADPNRRSTMEAKSKELETRISSREKLIEDSKKDEKKARNMKWLEQNLAKLRAEQQQVKMELESIPVEDMSAKSFMTYDYPGMDKQVGDVADILAMTEALKKKFPALKNRSKN